MFSGVPGAVTTDTLTHTQVAERGAEQKGTRNTGSVAKLDPDFLRAPEEPRELKGSGATWKAFISRTEEAIAAAGKLYFPGFESNLFSVIDSTHIY